MWLSSARWQNKWAWDVLVHKEQRNNSLMAFILWHVSRWDSLSCLLSYVFTGAHVLSPAAVWSNTALFWRTDNGRGGLGTGGGKREEAQWRVCRLPAFPTVAFVVIHWWLWEPPSLCKSVFASQVFAWLMWSQAQESGFSVYLALHSLEAKRPESMHRCRDNIHSKPGN